MATREINTPTDERLLKSERAKVNINQLLSKIRQQKNKEKKENYIFFTLIFLAVAVTGIIASY